MGAPVEGFEAAEDSTAEALLGSLKGIAAVERRKHASIFNYWLSIRGKRAFPPIRDLDPLEISDAGPFSLLLEMVGGGEDADIRHIGHLLKAGIDVERVSEAPAPTLLACIAGKLPIVAATRQPYAFEDEFDGVDGPTRCWVTLLPFSTSGTFVDYVYGFVSLDPVPDAAELAAPAEDAAPEPEPVEEPPEEPSAPEEPEQAAEPEPEQEPETVIEPEPQPERVATSSGRAGFSAKFFESLANVGGFYGRVVDLDPNEASVAVKAAQDEPVHEEPEPEPSEPAVAEAPEPELDPVEAEIEDEAPHFEPGQPQSTSEGILQSKLTEVRAKADEARLAKLRANAALYEGLSAVYDFALDAEGEPEEYLRLVEAEGLKIQLRSPMAPVVKLAFNGMCDDKTIAQLEAVLAWALKNDLPRGSLAERIEAEGGITPLLGGLSKAA